MTAMMETKDETNATSETALFLERDEAFQCIDCLCADREKTLEAKSESLQRFRNILDKYLEYPTLLDHSMQEMVVRLATSIQRVLQSDRYETGVTVADSGSIQFSQVCHALSALYALSKVRGRKIVHKFLPHEVQDVEPIWNCLETLLTTTPDSSEVMVDQRLLPPQWESIFMLFQWMTVLSLVPFQSDIVAGDERVEALLRACRETLSETGPTREAAACCWAAWLARPDSKSSARLRTACEYAQRIMQDFISKQSHAKLFQVLGVLQTLTTLLKTSSMERHQLAQRMSPLWKIALALGDSSDNMLLSKLLVKWWTRMGCVHLPPKIAMWRYQRGKRTLLDNLQQNEKLQSKEATRTNAHKSDLDELFVVPDQVEDAMGRVLESLSHSSTGVRWSAAKGVGRITERLPAICALDVLDAVLELFENPEKDQCWHGACLALAELARRGLLLPESLHAVVPHIVSAIQYDRLRGQTSVGASVRDAACYTYWAFCRAYHPAVLRPFLGALSEAIVLTSLFDREVNCRRAASAAFQEAVGRQGATSFPNGIAILTVADYFSLGNRTEAYTSIALQVARFNGFQMPIMRHLCTTKLFHWDEVIRRLTSKALYNLISNEESTAPYFASVVLPALMESSLDERNLNVRHGSVLGVAEITLGLSKYRDLKELSEDNITSLVGLIAAIEKKRLYRGRGGEIMRSAVCRLVECLSLAQIPMNVREQVRHLDSVDASIPHPSEDIQVRSCLALKELMLAYFPVGEKGPSERLQTRVVDKFVKIASTSDNPAATRGYALALGYLPEKLLAPSTQVLDRVMSCLQEISRYDARVGGEGDAATRRNALFSLARIAQKVGMGPSLSPTPYPIVHLDTRQCKQIFDSLLLALNDYKTDRRGDVGSWCRMAAMDGLKSLLLLTVNCEVELSSDGPVSQIIVAALLKQMAEKLDSVRQRAGETLESILLTESPSISGIPHKDELKKALGLDQNSVDDFSRRRWANPATAFEPVLRTVSLNSIYFQSVFSGIVISVGDLTESVSKEASSSLLQWVRSADNTSRKGMLLLILRLLDDHRGTGRVILPTLRTLAFLLSHRCVNNDIVGLFGSFLEVFEREASACKDVKRLLVIVDVTVALLLMVSLADIDPKTKSRALLFLCQMLAHPFPRVRAHVAQEFYLYLLESESEAAPTTVIMNTAWSTESNEAVASAASQVAIGLGLHGPGIAAS